MHRRRGAARWAAFRIEARLDRLDQGRADDDAVGGLRDGPRMLGGLDAEADADRQRRVALDARDGAGNLGEVGRAGAGDAGDRDVVDEAGGVLEHFWQALVVRGRRREADEVEPGGE